MKSKKRIYFISLITVSIIMGVFLNSFYWPYEEISKRKILVYCIVLLGVIAVPVLNVKVESCYKIVEKVLQQFKIYANNIMKNKQRILLVLCAIAMCMGGSCLTTKLVSTFLLQTDYNSRLFFVLVAVGTICITMLFLWKSASKHVEIIFLIIALSMGLLCIKVTPSRVGVSWDDEVHYAKTLEIANALNGIMYKADEKNISDYAKNIHERLGYDRQSDAEYSAMLQESYDKREWSAHNFTNYGVWSIAYIPSAIGIVLGRGIGLSYEGVFNLGRIFNLLTYVLTICFAIQRMKYGKVLVAAVGLIPTTIFMAVSFSYDSWVTGFTILGFAYFFAELQDDEPLTKKNIGIIIGSIALGCMPKAIYFSLLFPLLFMPRRKFQDKRQRKRYYLAIIGAGVVLVSTFILPILLGGAGNADLRAGADVNSIEQIKYILNNPFTYAKMLIKYELDYISLVNSATMLQKFAYVGNGYFYSTVSLVLVVVAFLDRGEERNCHFIKGTTMIGCLATIILSTTALYISFTPVGANTVVGMQGRYLIPTIFPALYSLGTEGTTHRINKNAFVCLPMLAIAFSFVYNMIEFCVLHY